MNQVTEGKFNMFDLLIHFVDHLRCAYFEDINKLINFEAFIVNVAIGIITQDMFYK